MKSPLTAGTHPATTAGTQDGRRDGSGERTPEFTPESPPDPTLGAGTGTASTEGANPSGPTSSTLSTLSALSTHSTPPYPPSLRSTSSPPSSPQRLGRHHFAFLRGWAQGLPLPVVADQYLGEGLDLRVVKSTLRRLRDHCIALAHRHDRPTDAASLRRSVFAMPSSATTLPTFETFASQFPEDFYSEAELIQLFNTRFDAPEYRTAQRRARLIDRQLIALRWLESIAAEPVALQHTVTSWLEPAVAARLNAADIFSFDDLVRVVAVRGARWWTHVPRLGEIGAKRLEAFLRMHFERRVFESVRATSALMPTALLDMDTQSPTLRRELTGVSGSNRAPHATNGLLAEDDFAAVRAWLATYQVHSSTWRAYRKEAERLLLWCLIERNKPLSSLAVEDCVAYRDFLYAQEPEARWVGPSSHPRWSPLWRPFTGPLAPTSVRHAMTVLSLLFTWLVAQRYLTLNPWLGVGSLAARRPKLQIKRSFTLTQWNYILDGLTRLDDSLMSHRLRFIVQFGHATGLRLSELAGATFDDLEQVDLGDDGAGWILRVIGKGQVEREVPLTVDAEDALSDYLTARGLLAQFEMLDGTTPLIARATPGDDSAVSSSAIYQSLKTFFAGVANHLSGPNKKDADKIRSASTHWLRHSFGTHFVAGGGELDVLRDVLGHRSLTTTSVYVSSEHRRRFEQMRKVVSGRSTTR